MIKLQKIKLHESVTVGDIVRMPFFSPLTHEKDGVYIEVCTDDQAEIIMNLNRANKRYMEAYGV